MWLNLSVWAAAVCAAILVGCSGGGAGGGSSGGPTTPSLLVDFVRNTAPADGSFKVVYWQSSASAAVQAFSSLPLVNATRGLVSASVLRSDGKREVTVTPGAQKTGEYSVTLNCILSGNPSSAFCQSPLGPVVAPQRPHMPGASRVGINTVHHGCPSLNFDSSPVPVPPIAMYGFRRQAAGSYAEPFVFAFNGGDGCVAPWGPTVRANGDGSYRSLPRSTILVTQASFLGANTHRGNPHVYYSGATPSLLFFDDETKTAVQQFVYASARTGAAWGGATALNFPPFNTTGFGDTQPYFDGSQLILRNGSKLLSYAYNLGPMANPASWAAPVTLLAPANALPQAGSVVVVGEPTVAAIGGQDVLFFVYGIHQTNGSVNLRAGYVKKGT